jgi:hypothetical protein
MMFAYYWTGKMPDVPMSRGFNSIEAAASMCDPYLDLRAKLAKKIPELRGYAMSDCLRANREIGAGIFFRADPTMTILFPQDHPRAGEPRFHWTPIGWCPGLYRGIEVLHDEPVHA